MPRDRRRPAPTRLRAAPACLAALTSALLACGEGLPQEGLVIGPRVLAVRTEVVASVLMPEDDPELAPRAQALPLDEVELHPFVVDPEGVLDPASLDALWIACEQTPGQFLFDCIGDAMPTTLAELPECPRVDPAQLFAGGSEALPPFPSPCVVAREGKPRFQVPFSEALFAGGSIELTLIAGLPQSERGPVCADLLLSGEHELPDDCLFAVQRLTLGPLERLLALLTDFGVDPGIELPPVEEIPDADRHPRISSISIEHLDEAGEVTRRYDAQSGDSVLVEAEETLRIHTVSPESDLQAYPILVNEGASLQQEREAYDGRWFRTWGRLLSGSSDDPESFNEWRAVPGSQDVSEDLPAAGAHLFYVVRDGRQGVSWWNLRVQLASGRSAP